MAVVVATCGCCGEPKFIENVDAAQARVRTGEVIFCEACMGLPDEEAERRIRVRDMLRDIELREVLERSRVDAPVHEMVMMNGQPVVLLGGLADQ
jgi:hypothetical protein